jgi:hypothetical protein
MGYLRWPWLWVGLLVLGGFATAWALYIEESPVIGQYEVVTVEPITVPWTGEPAALHPQAYFRHFMEVGVSGNFTYEHIETCGYETPILKGRWSASQDSLVVQSQTRAAPVTLERRTGSQLGLRITDADGRSRMVVFQRVRDASTWLDWLDDLL